MRGERNNNKEKGIAEKENVEGVDSDLDKRSQHGFLTGQAKKKK